MNYITALKFGHDLLKPQAYFEIGCRKGISLSLARCPSIAVDPDFEITQPLKSPTRIFKETSDRFFERDEVLEIIGQKPDMAFIDGMHQVEFALRDFVNLEKISKPTTVIFIDDVLPQDMAWTSRTREGQYWTGDVYRLIPLLRQYRPDLDIQVFDVDLKGLAIISNLDPMNGSLKAILPGIEAKLKKGDWNLHSVEEIRSVLNPLPCESLTDYLSTLSGQKPEIGNPGAGACDARELYLDLLKKSVLNEIYLDDELRIFYLRQCIEGKLGFDHASLQNIRESRREDFRELENSRLNGYFPYRKISNSGFSHAMMGRLRIDSLHECLNHIARESVPGDLVECGVWRGGGCIFMAGYLKAHEMQERRVVLADSFEGLPKPQHTQDMKLDLSKEHFPELAVDLDTVRRNFEAYELLGDNIVFLKGWFKDTLPNAPVEEIGLLRLDGDLYQSTIECLESLYDKVVPGGVVIVDDWGAIEQCRRAVTDFFAARGEAVPDATRIDWTGVYWMKSN